MLTPRNNPRELTSPPNHVCRPISIPTTPGWTQDREDRVSRVFRLVARRPRDGRRFEKVGRPWGAVLSFSHSDGEIGTRERASGCIQVSEGRKKERING